MREIFQIMFRNQLDPNFQVAGLQEYATRPSQCLPISVYKVNVRNILPVSFAFLGRVSNWLQCHPDEKLMKKEGFRVRYERKVKFFLILCLRYCFFNLRYNSNTLRIFFNKHSGESTTFKPFSKVLKRIRFYPVLSAYINTLVLPFYRTSA